MANQGLTDLIREVNETNTILDSAKTYIQGVPGLINDAVAQATANGATAEELAPLTQLAADLDAKANDVAAAIQANTSAKKA
jgi:hypothetical protein